MFSILELLHNKLQTMELFAVISNTSKKNIDVSMTKCVDVIIIRLSEFLDTFLTV